MRGLKLIYQCRLSGSPFCPPFPPLTSWNADLPFSPFGIPLFPPFPPLLPLLSPLFPPFFPLLPPLPPPPPLPFFSITLSSSLHCYFRWARGAFSIVFLLVSACPCHLACLVFFMSVVCNSLSVWVFQCLSACLPLSLFAFIRAGPKKMFSWHPTRYIGLHQ